MRAGELRFGCKQNVVSPQKQKHAVFRNGGSVHKLLHPLCINIHPKNGQGFLYTAGIIYHLYGRKILPIGIRAGFKVRGGAPQPLTAQRGCTIPAAFFQLTDLYNIGHGVGIGIIIAYIEPDTVNIR